MNPVPWYTSPVYKGIAVALICGIVSISPKVAASFGLIDKESINTFVTDLFQGIGMLSLVYAERKRAKSEIQPLTLSQKSADAKTTILTQAATDMNVLSTQTTAITKDTDIHTDQKPPEPKL
jgi:hypothetical protein